MFEDPFDRLDYESFVDSLQLNVVFLSNLSVRNIGFNISYPCSSLFLSLCFALRAASFNQKFRRIIGSNESSTFSRSA